MAGLLTRVRHEKNRMLYGETYPDRGPESDGDWKGKLLVGLVLAACVGLAAVWWAGWLSTVRTDEVYEKSEVPQAGGATTSLPKKSAEVRPLIFDEEINF